MFSEKEVLSTFEMVKNEHLDVRTITLGISIFDCSSDSLLSFQEKLTRKIVGYAARLVQVCDKIGDKYGVPVVNKRIAISPVAVAGAGFKTQEMVKIAKTLDKIAREVDIDFIGGFSALIEKGMTQGDKALIEAIPEALSSTERVCASVNAASSKAGINMDGVYLLARIIKEAAEKSKDKDGLACAKMCVLPIFPRMFLLWLELTWE